MPGKAVSLANVCRSCRGIARFVLQQCARRSHQFAWCVCWRFRSYLRCVSGWKVLRHRVYCLFLCRLSAVDHASTATRSKYWRRTVPAEERMFAHSGLTSTGLCTVRKTKWPGESKKNELIWGALESFLSEAEEERERLNFILLTQVRAATLLGVCLKLWSAILSDRLSA